MVTHEFTPDELDVISRLETDAARGLGAADPGQDYWDSFVDRAVERRVEVPTGSVIRQRLAPALFAVAAAAALIMWLVPPGGSGTVLPIEGVDDSVVFWGSEFSTGDVDWLDDVFVLDLDDELEELSPQELDAVLVALEELRRS